MAIMCLSSYLLMFLLHCAAAFEEEFDRVQLKSNSSTSAGTPPTVISTSTGAFRTTKEKENTLQKIIGGSVVGTSTRLYKVTESSKTLGRKPRPVGCKPASGAGGSRGPEVITVETGDKTLTEKPPTRGCKPVSREGGSRRPQVITEIIKLPVDVKPGNGEKEKEDTTEKLDNGNRGQPILPPIPKWAGSMFRCGDYETLGCKQSELTCQKKEDLMYASRNIFWQQVTMRPTQCDKESCVCVPGFVRSKNQCVLPRDCSKPPPSTKPPSKKG